MCNKFMYIKTNTESEMMYSVFWIYKIYRNRIISENVSHTIDF